MTSPRKARKKTAFVPRVIFQAAAVSAVVPLCAACGGQTQPLGVALACYGDDAGCPSTDASDDVLRATVAARCFADEGCYVPEAGPPDARDDIEYTVAAKCFDGGCGVADAGFADAPLGVADTGFADARLGVALDAFSGDGESPKH